MRKLSGAEVRHATGTRSKGVDAECDQFGFWWCLIRGLVWRFKPGGEAGPCFICKHLHGGERTLGLIFAEFAVEEGVIEAGARGIGVASSVIDDVETRPVACGQTHGAGLATGVELTAFKREGRQRFACGANRVDFAVRCGIVRGGDGVDAFADDAAVANDNRCKRATGAGACVFSGERDGAAQELRIGLCACGLLARNLPQGRK